MLTIDDELTRIPFGSSPLCLCSRLLSVHHHISKSTNGMYSLPSFPSYPLPSSSCMPTDARAAARPSYPAFTAPLPHPVRIGSAQRSEALILVYFAAKRTPPSETNPPLIDLSIFFLLPLLFRQMRLGAIYKPFTWQRGQRRRGGQVESVDR
jgi:hypothetical protein